MERIAPRYVDVSGFVLKAFIRVQQRQLFGDPGQKRNYNVLGKSG